MLASPSPVPVPSRWVLAGCAAILALAALAAYHNTFLVPFVFDDTLAIPDNPTIRDLRNLKEILLPGIGHGITVSGRPVLNLSLALCYAVSGTEVWSYHACNLAVHLLAGLTLFGIVRRTLMTAGGMSTTLARSSSKVAPRVPPVSWPRILQRDATPLAFAVALLWTLHPLQTESVTYIIQRAESLMGLFFLLTLYGFIRAVASPHPWPWRVVAVLACLGGIGTKEVAATAPVLVFLYDRTFVAGSFREAWRRRRWLHLSLAATWVPLVLLVAGAGWDRGGTAGFHEGVAWWEYWLTQGKAIVLYLKLAVWPHPLVFEYGTIRLSFREALPFALLVLSLLVGTVTALVRWPVVGFLGTWFFIILAPTSIVPGTMQMIVEHRMYLPLATVIAGLVIGMHASLIRLSESAESGGSSPRPHRPWLRHPALPGLALALPLGLLTVQRNSVYRDDLTLWQDTVARSPASARAQSALGTALHTRNRPDEAIDHFLISLRLDPTRVETLYNAGLALAEKGRLSEAITYCEKALRINPDFFPARYQMGLALLQMNRPEDALAQFAETVRLNPNMAEARYEWGVALDRTGRLVEAVAKYEAALRLKPDFASAECDMGTALFRLDRVPEAAASYRRALRVEPGLADAHFNLGLALARMGSKEDAAAAFAEAVRLKPEHAAAQFNLGLALAQAGRVEDALGPLHMVVKLEPTAPEARYTFGNALAGTGRFIEAVDQFEAALRLRPDFAGAHFSLGRALLQLSRTTEARQHFESALRIDPSFEPARQMLEHLRMAGREP